MSFDQDPGEQAQVSAADFAMMCDEMKKLRRQRDELLEALEQSKLLECDFTEITHADKSKELKCSCEGFMRRVRVVRAHHQ